MSLTLDPNWLEKVKQSAAVKNALFAAGSGFAGSVDENIRAGERSGNWYEGNPRQSSAPGEYPQEQSGDLRDGIGVDIFSNGRVVAGFIRDTPAQAYAFDLEELPPSMEGRPFLRPTALEPETHATMREAARDAVK